MNVRRLVQMLALLIAFASVPICHAQGISASIGGIVKDRSDLAIPGTEITLTNKETRVASSTLTNKSGVYRVPGLRPGGYVLHAEKHGFKYAELQNIQLTVGQELVQDIRLQVGTVDQVVSVNVEEAEVNTSNGAVTTVIGKQLIDNLPVNGRSLATLFELTPGVLQAPSSSQNPGGFIVNGQRASANNLMIDGVSGNVSLTPTFGSNVGGVGLPTSASGGTNGILPMDAIEEFRIQTSTYSAEFGRSPGAQIQVRSRGGSDRFHGTVFEYFRNQALDATDWFVKHAGKTEPALRMNDFGGTLSGPILHGRLFGLVAHETLLMHQPRFSTFDVPSMSTKQTAAPSLRPFLAVFPDGNSTSSSCPNADPSCDPAKAGADIYDNSYLNIVVDHSTSTRVDYKMNPKLSLFERVNIAPSSIDLRSVPGGGLESVDYYTSTTGMTFVASPRLVDEANVGYARTGASDQQHLIGGVGSDTTGVDASIAALRLPPNAYLTFATPIGTYNSGTSYGNTQNQWNLVNTVSMNIGRHLLKGGVDYRRSSPSIVEGSELTLSTGYKSLQNIATGVLESVNLFASAPLSSPAFKFLYNNLSVFAQDTWRITDRLTIDYGVRWEVTPPPSDGHGGPLAITGPLDNLSEVETAAPGTPLWSTTYTNIAPRFGFAYRVNRSTRFGTVVRGGFGRFYDTGTTSAVTNTLAGAYPYSASVTVSNITLGQINTNALTLQSAVLPQASLNVYDPNLKLPRTYQWSLILDQSLGSRATIGVSYIGNEGRALLIRGLHGNKVSPLATNLLLTTNGGSSKYEALQIQAKGAVFGGLSGIVGYTWSHALDDIDDEFSQTTTNAPLQFASSGFDIRHMFSVGAHWAGPPAGRRTFVDVIRSGWSMDAITKLQTASPLTVTAQTNPAFTQLYNATPRADIVPGVQAVIENPTYPGGKGLNRAAFTSPPSSPVRQGTSGRNAYRLFGLTQFDLAVSKQLFRTERLNVLLRIDGFNVLNTPNFSSVSTGLSSATFGQATNTYAGSYGSTGADNPSTNQVFANGAPRNIQASLKMTF